jgi:hypothetical protein
MTAKTAMKTKLWVDDLRPAPDASWEWIKTAPAAVLYLQACSELDLRLERISLDHDLGYRGESRYVLEEHDSKSVMNFIEQAVFAGTMREPVEIVVHSANPSGRRWLEGAIGSVQRLATRFR